MTKKLILLIMLGVLVLAGAAYAQDDDDDFPIAPGGATVMPTATATQSVDAPVPAATTDGEGLPTVTATVPTDEAATSTPTRVFVPAPQGTLTPTLEPTPIPFRVVVDVESAFIRANPAPDAPPAASAFRDDLLEVIGRNLDGTYFEVARPYRPDESIGWVSVEVVEYEFLPELLPLTDIETGVTGNEPLTSPPEFAVFVNEGVALRTLPNVQRGDRILNIPPSVVVPVLGRFGEGEWLLVNYLGNEGWIVGFAARQREDILTVKELTGVLPADVAPQAQTTIISPEVQMEQLEAVREYAEARTDLARQVEAFWWAVQQGEVIPCDPPAAIQEYRYGPREVQVLPELDRYLPRMNEGVGLLNQSIDTLDNCGVIDPRAVQSARNAAINAKVILENTLVQLDNLEEIIEFNS